MVTHTNATKHLLVLVMALALIMCAAACRNKKSQKTRDARKVGATITTQKPKPALPQLPAPNDQKSKEIEAVTGAHTRVVWNECQKAGESDPFSHDNDQFLNGIDTRDGMGERSILAKMGNYSRPMLTGNGRGILYTRKGKERRNGKNEFIAEIFRTDWQGNEPVRISAGYAVDVWTDSATEVEWVYLVRKFKSVNGPGLVARQLCRVRLDDPKVEEVLYGDSRITPDNIQLSRDGHLASGLFPHPSAGVFHFDGKNVTVQKLLNGCWPSASPDDSGISWIFDGGHKGATFFADNGARSWYVSFDAPCAKVGETFHPRWTNHPAYMVLTGPYVGPNTGQQAVKSEQNKADVFLGRFDEKAEKLEAWVQITKPGLAKAYPDAWIAGGDKASLKNASVAQPAAAAETAKWPASLDELLFLWFDNKTLNTWKDPLGHSHTADLIAQGSARIGRFDEMVFDGGEFEVDEEDAEPIISQLKSQPDMAFEAAILFRAPGTHGRLLSTPAFSLDLDDTRLQITSKEGTTHTAASAELTHHVHLVLNRRGANYEVFVNGKSLAVAPGGNAPAAEVKRIIFGSETLSRGMSHVAFYGRELSQEEVTRNAHTQLSRLASLPPPPAQVHMIGKLVEMSRVPTLESIEPYTRALISCVYEVESVSAGELNEKRILVKHWGLLNRLPVKGFPRAIGKSYELTLERGSDHAELRGERVIDDTSAFDLQPWIDVAPPRTQ
jgi:hypothetical protein